jgi:hypothetical protein
VHPIEHLRYVARARGADPASLVRETAHALSSMRFDPSGLVVACRRIVERHPDCAPLWWLCSRLLTSPEPFELAWAIADEIHADPTVDELVAVLPDAATVLAVGWPDQAGQALIRRGDLRVLVADARHDGSSFVQRLERYDVECELVPAEAVGLAAQSADLVVLEATALSPDRVVAPVGSAPAAAVARTQGVPVWLVAGLGRSLPAPIVDAIAERLAEPSEPWAADHETFDLEIVSHVARPGGLHDLAVGAPDVDCATAPELLRTSPI